MTLPVFDKQKSRGSFDRAASQYDRHARLQKQVASALIRHTQGYAAEIKPQTILDLGCGTGQITQAMCEQHAEANVFALDFSPKMLGQTQQRLALLNLHATLLCADAEQIPLQADSMDLVISSLMLQWSNNLEASLTGIHNVLKPKGVLAFSSFSEGTLKEVKAAWSHVDGDAHSSDFKTLESFESAASAAGFSSVNVIPQTIVMQYASVRAMLNEMKGIGASNARSERPKGLTGKQRFAAFESAMDLGRTMDVGYPCTWEVTYVICAK